ncbi:unnamed protein product, partial [Meganyctiphanes norvegica]
RLLDTQGHVQVDCILRSVSLDASEMFSRNCTKETTEPTIGEVTGTIPPWLEGRLIRVGPGIRKVGKTEYVHLFDGMAMLHQVEIKNGTATYRSRFLESDTYKKNMAAQRIIVTEFGTIPFSDPCASLYQRVSSWFFPPSGREMTDNCGVQVLQIKDELIAMSEVEAVRIVDPETLKTIGDKVKFRNYVAVNQATAHPHIESDGTAYNLCFGVGCGGPMYSIIALPNGKIQHAQLQAQVKPRWRFNPAYFHSFGITENFFIIGETPLVMDVKKVPGLALMTASPADLMTWHGNEKTRFRVIRRGTGDEVPIKYFTDAYFAFHHVNAYEKDGFLIIDVCAADNGRLVLDSLFVENMMKKANDPSKLRPTAETRRYVLPLDIKSSPTEVDLLISCEDAQLNDASGYCKHASAFKVKDDEVYLQGLQINPILVEMPRINYKYNGRPYRYMYGVGIDINNSFDFNAIIKIDNLKGKEIVWSEKDIGCQEPVFVASPDAKTEDDGVILSLLLHDNNKHKICVLRLNHERTPSLARKTLLAQWESRICFK